MGWLMFKDGRSIPAPAGEPASLREVICGTQVYPRACGGTLSDGLNVRTVYGLSPRLRGTR